MSAAVEAYQDATSRLAADTERQVLATLTALAAGQIIAAAAMAAIAAIINRANAVATGLADAWLAVQIEQATAGATPTPAVGVLPVDDTERLVKAVRTILASDSDTAMQLSRLARSEPLATAQRVSTEAMAHHEVIRGWTRQLDADPCELCVWWCHDGLVRPTDHPFEQHPGCNCQARIVLTHKEIHNA